MGANATASPLNSRKNRGQTMVEMSVFITAVRCVRFIEWSNLSWREILPRVDFTTMETMPLSSKYGGK